MAVRFVRFCRPAHLSGSFVRPSVRFSSLYRFCFSQQASLSSFPALPFPASPVACRGMYRPVVSVLALPRGLSAACRCVLQADVFAGRCLTCLRRHFLGILPASWGPLRYAVPCCAVPCRAAPLPGYSSGFGLLSGVEGWSVAPETEQGMPSASTRAPILISSPSGIFSSPCAGVSRSIV